MDATDPPVRTSLNLPVVDVENDQSVVNFTQTLRTSVITALCPQGIVPTDQETIILMLKAASDMDKVAISKMRIKADEKIADNQAQAASVIADILRQQKTGLDSLVFAGVANPPSLGSEFVKPDLAPGEMDISPPMESVDVFMRKHKPDHAPA